MHLLHKYNRIVKNCNLIFYILQDHCSFNVYATKILDPSGSPEMIFQYEILFIIFIPPNATGNCEPLDQGIIWSFKACFCCAQLNHLMSEYKIWQASECAPNSQFKLMIILTCTTCLAGSSQHQIALKRKLLNSASSKQIVSLPCPISFLIKILINQLPVQVKL
jgi:DDE superfamily endonuclease